MTTSKNVTCYSCHVRKTETKVDTQIQYCTYYRSTCT